MIIEALEQSVDDLLEHSANASSGFSDYDRLQLESQLKSEIHAQGKLNFVPFLSKMTIRQPLIEIDGPAFQASPFGSMMEAQHVASTKSVAPQGRRPPRARGSHPLPNLKGLSLLMPTSYDNPVAVPDVATSLAEPAEQDNQMEQD